MILTVTPNPSIDLLFAADRLVWDDANRLDSPRRRPGGQGINVVRAARELGAEAVALALLGGAVGAELEALLDDEGTPLIAVPIDAETRVFVGVREAATSRSLLLNPRGPRVASGDAERLLAAIDTSVRCHRPRWLACCGSLPPGMPEDLYARVADVAREQDAAFVVDCDGDALRLAARAGCDVLTPNAHEAERLLEWTRGSIDGPAAAAAAAREIVDRFRTRVVFITLGAAGAVAGHTSGTWHAAAATGSDGIAESGSAVGAGDAFLAAALHATDTGHATERALCSGVAAGSAVLRSRGGALLARDDYENMLQKTNARRIV